jgi:hypothetical protein
MKLREIDGDNEKNLHQSTPSEKTVVYNSQKISLQEAQEKVETGRGRFELRENNTELHEKEHLR